MNIPDELLYTKDHEWVSIEGDIATIGITEFAQGELGDVVFVQLPEIGSSFARGDAFGTIEAVKAVADLYAPVSGEIVEINNALEEKPEIINQKPFGEGWITKVKLSNFSSEKTELLDPSAYRDLTTA